MSDIELELGLKEYITTPDKLRRMADEADEAGLHHTDEIREAAHELENLHKLYYKLLWAVSSVHKGETRHQTALRYIQERENRAQCAAKETIDEPNP